MRPDVADRTTVDIGGGVLKLSALTDKVGGIIQAVNSNAPTRPGIDDTGAWPAIVYAGAQFMPFAAGQLVSAAVSHTVWCAYDATNAAGTTECLFDVQTGRFFLCHLVNAGNKSGHFDNTNAYVGIAAAASGRQRMVWQLDNGTSKATLYRNGGSLGQGNYHGYPVGGDAAIGAAFNNSIGFNGKIYDWGWRPSLLDAAELANLHGYLARYA
jgi:hypothetical protein